MIDKDGGGGTTFGFYGGDTAVMRGDNPQSKDEMTNKYKKRYFSYSYLVRCSLRHFYARVFQS